MWRHGLYLITWGCPAVTARHPDHGHIAQRESVKMATMHALYGTMPSIGPVDWETPTKPMQCNGHEQLSRYGYRRSQPCMHAWFWDIHMEFQLARRGGDLSYGLSWRAIGSMSTMSSVNPQVPQPSRKQNASWKALIHHIQPKSLVPHRGQKWPLKRGLCRSCSSKTWWMTGMSDSTHHASRRRQVLLWCCWITKQWSVTCVALGANRSAWKGYGTVRFTRLRLCSHCQWFGMLLLSACGMSLSCEAMAGHTASKAPQVVVAMWLCKHCTIHAPSHSWGHFRQLDVKMVGVKMGARTHKNRFRWIVLFYIPSLTKTILLPSRCPCLWPKSRPRNWSPPKLHFSSICCPRQTQENQVSPK